MNDEFDDFVKLTYTSYRIAFFRMMKALETIASAVKDGTIQMRDVDRAKVYSEHLGKKLVKDDKED